ncbi:MAG: prepilin-type N-terminal cleavage/methylation domain-containing protein [Candidatus Omnitrophota bacterium]
MNNNNRLHGTQSFTLLELIIVVLIFSITMGIIFPRFKDTFINFQFDNFVNEFISIARFARGKAISSSAYYQIEIDPGQNRYRVKRVLTEEGVTEKYTYQRWHHIPKDITIEGDTQVLMFTPLGNTLKTVLYVFNASGKSIALRITTTGFIRLYTGRL